MKTAEKQAQAYERYLSGQTQKTICKELDLDPPELRGWISQGHWKKRRTEAQNEVLTMVDDQFISFVKKERTETAMAHMKIAKLIRNHVTKVLKRIDSFEFAVQDLQSLARTAKDAADIEARAVNISDKANIGLPTGNESNSRPQMLLMPGVAPIAVNQYQLEESTPKIINVTTESLKDPF